MRINPVQLSFYNSVVSLNKNNQRKTQTNPLYFDKGLTKDLFVSSANKGVKVSFGQDESCNRRVMNIDHSDYIAMWPSTKKRLRRLYKDFNRGLVKDVMFDPKNTKMPLQTERNMDKFIEISSKYIKYKDQPIICLGRSPKWFLNTALWMEDGIPGYKYVAFSGYWYRPSPEGMRRLPKNVPTDKEEAAYRKYLNRIQADPKTIVEHMEQTGKKTVITDYICSGKGACSFLDLMGRYADELGILEQFSKSIQIVGIGSMDYMEELNRYADEISIPQVQMPEILMPYHKNVEQTFYNMDYGVFREMLLNQNVNECRSTYYPHKMWTIYKPDKFKTGLVSDPKKIKQKVQEAGGVNKEFAHFSAPMGDLRNLMNFHILDQLSKRGLLKKFHIAKM